MPRRGRVYIGEVADATQRAHRLMAGFWAGVALLLCVAAWPLSGLPASAAATSTSSTSSKSAPLSAPKTTVEQDTKFFAEVTKADPSLETYAQGHGNVALEALLTDGSAFCALLKRGGGIDEALVEEAEGARSTEAQTSIPLSVTTFNTIESVALLTLCRSEQKLVPASVRSKLRRLADNLAKPSG